MFGNQGVVGKSWHYYLLSKMTDFLVSWSLFYFIFPNRYCRYDTTYPVSNELCTYYTRLFFCVFSFYMHLWVVVRDKNSSCGPMFPLSLYILLFEAGLTWSSPFQLGCWISDPFAAFPDMSASSQHREYKHVFPHQASHTGTGMSNSEPHTGVINIVLAEPHAHSQ